MSERLEEIDRIVEGLYNDKIELRNFVQESLDQAERVDKLENDNNWLDGGWDAEIRMRRKRDERINGLLEQNKRYREALEFYADKDNYEHETIVSDCDIEVESKILEDGGTKARQELEESE